MQTKHSQFGWYKIESNNYCWQNQEKSALVTPWQQENWSPQKNTSKLKGQLFSFENFTNGGIKGV